MQKQSCKYYLKQFYCHRYMFSHIYLTKQKCQQKQKKIQSFNMKGFIFRNQRSKLKLSNHRSQINKQNALAQPQSQNFAVTPLLKVCKNEQNSSIPHLHAQKNKKVTFQRNKIMQNGHVNSDHVNNSKLSRRSFSQNDVTKSKRNFNKVFSVSKAQKNSSSSQIKISAVKTLKYIEDKSIFRQLIEQMVNILKRQYIIQRNHIKFYSVKKQSFQEMFSYFFTLFTSNNQDKIEAIHAKYTSLNFLKNCTDKIGYLVKEQLINQKQSRLNLSSNMGQYTYSHNIYQRQISHQRNQLQNLLKDEQQIKVKKKYHEDTDNFYKKEIEENLLQIRHQLQEKNKLESIIKDLNEQKNKLNKDIEQHTILLNQTKTIEQKITNFVNQQNNKMLKIVSEDYKRIQSDIYEYAVYLQSNQLASDINYEPAPFQIIEEKIMEEMKNVNKTIIQDDQIDIDIKNKMMRDFIVLVMQKFKKKDSQLIKLLDFKTKCIRKFVSNMQMWLDNWTLKQEYLVNLRNQFFIDTNKLSENIQRIRCISYCDGCTEKQGKLFQSIVEVYQKIELNYKMGNSFY